MPEKKRVLYRAGKSFKGLPGWQKRGVGLFWETYAVHVVHPLTREELQAERRKIKVEYDIPVKDEYERFILKLVRAK